jgi:deoxyribodipyrimidine photo-lyase
MWFASVWIFTLQLPWALGADFFMRHLLDGCPASNTLSWRWVAGLHTQGKTYLARPDNIATFTNGRFQPPAHTLATHAMPLTDGANLERAPIALADRIPSGARLMILITEEDLTPEFWPLDGALVTGVAVLDTSSEGPAFSAPVRAFKAAARADALHRAQHHFKVPAVVVETAEELLAACRAAGAQTVVTPRVPIGSLKAAVGDMTTILASHSLPLQQIMHPWDSQFWPHAKAGFFQLKDKIPRVLAGFGLAGASS